MKRLGRLGAALLAVAALATLTFAGSSAGHGKKPPAGPLTEKAIMFASDGMRPDLMERYADKRTEAIKGALEETDRRRAIQLAYNEEHGITPESIIKGVSDIAEFLALESPTVPKGSRRRGAQKVDTMPPSEIQKLIVTLEEEMFAAADDLRFEYAAKLRDEIKELRRELLALAAV